MRLKCKRQHMPWPGVRIPHGYELVLGPENDDLAHALVKRGWFEEDKDNVADTQDVIEAPEKEAAAIDQLVINEQTKPPDKRPRK